MNEIIVYRNPIEAQFWHALQGGSFFIVICAVLAFFVSFLFLNWSLTKIFKPSWRDQHVVTWVAIVTATLLAIAVLWRMA